MLKQITMNYKKWLISFFFFFISSVVFSQINPEVLTFSKGSYYYQNKYYKHNKLSPILEVSPKAHEVYKEYLKDRRKVFALSALSITWAGLGSYLITRDPCNYVDSPDECDGVVSTEQFIGGILVLGSAVSAIVCLTKVKRTKNRLRKSIKIFNEGLSPAVGVSPIHLNLQTTNNGVGLVLNF